MVDSLKTNNIEQSIETKVFIGGEFVESVSKKKYPLVNPSTGEEWVQVYEADAADVDKAVTFAQKAWPAWASTVPAYEKAAKLRKLATIIRENADLIAKIESKTNGKPVSQFGFDVAVTAGCFDYFAALCESSTGTTSQTMPGYINFTLRQPFGVTAAIIPWNSPTIMFAFKIGAAVAAGNACILKSSEKAPLTPLLLAKFSVEAGFPPGLIQVLNGFGPTVGAALAKHMKIRKISFTGSTKTGRLISTMASESNLKNVTLELGGKSPAIIFADANIQEAAGGCAFSILQLSGQVCMATSRVYVEESIKDKFLEAYVAAFKQIAGVVGPATETDTTHGPQVDSIQYKQVLRYLELGRGEAKTFFGGQAIDRPGFFVQPTIFTDAADSAVISREEIFGPVAVVNTFRTEQEP